MYGAIIQLWNNPNSDFTSERFHIIEAATLEDAEKVAREKFVALGKERLELTKDTYLHCDMLIYRVFELRDGVKIDEYHALKSFSQFAYEMEEFRDIWHLY